MLSTPYSRRAASLNHSGYGSGRWTTHSKGRGGNEEPLIARVQLEGQPVVNELPQQNLRYLNYAEKSRQPLGACHEFHGRLRTSRRLVLEVQTSKVKIDRLRAMKERRVFMCPMSWERGQNHLPLRTTYLDSTLQTERYILYWVLKSI